MKRTNAILKLIPTLALAFGLSAGAGLAQVAADYPAFNHFNTAADGSGTISNWYGVPATLYWDGTQDAGGGAPGSGSLYVIATWATGGDNYALGLAFETNYVQFNATTNVINGYFYTNLEYDIKWDTVNSTIGIDTWNTTGDPQGAGVGLLTEPGVGQVPITNVNTYIPDAASNGWVHISQPIGRTILPGIDQVMGLWFKKYYNGPLGTAAFWIDNVKFDGAPILPPPTVELGTAKGAVAGLKFVASTSGQYDRQNIITYDDNFSWVGHGSTPYSYSVTLGAMPSSSNPNFVYHLFLVPGFPTEPSPDWNEPSVVYIDIENTASGGGSCAFRYKTNTPNDNGGYYSVNNPATINSATVLGTWTISFLNNTNITVFCPDGTSTNFNIPEVDAQYFNGPLEVYYGIMPSQGANVGQSAVAISAGISNGATAALYVNWQQSLTLVTNAPGGWIVSTTVSLDPNAVFIFTPTPTFTLTWPYANGFDYVLETNSVLSAPAGWSTNGFAASTVGATKVVNVPAANLPKDKIFFRLAKPGP